MIYKYLVALLFLVTFSFNSRAQTLEFYGKIPTAFKESSVTIFYEGSCDRRVRSATFRAFKAAGYRVFIDGERQPRFGGLTTNVTVGDTTFTRKSKDILIRSIHGNQPTDLVVTVSGWFTNVSVKRVFLDIIDRQTGELLLAITCQQRNISLGFDKYSDELLSILDPSAPEARPLYILPRYKRKAD